MSHTHVFIAHCTFSVHIKQVEQNNDREIILDFFIFYSNDSNTETGKGNASTNSFGSFGQKIYFELFCELKTKRALCAYNLFFDLLYIITI